MKLCDLLTIKPHNYDLLLNEKTKGSPEARALLEEMIREHKRFVGLRDYVIQFQYKCTQNLFAYGTEREPELLAWLAGNPVIAPIELDFSNTDAHSEEENMLADLEKDEEKESDQNNGSGEKKEVTAEDKAEKRGKKSLPLGETFKHELSEGDKVCSCCKGKMVISRTRQQTIVISQPVFTTQTHYIDTCRCLVCNTQNEAKGPEVLYQTLGRYHFKAVANMAALRYQYGMASYRLEAFSNNVGLRISDSTQWLVFENAASKLNKFVTYLKITAANAPVHQVDDTTQMVIAIAKAIEEEQINALKNGKNPDAVRSGIHTTNLTAVCEKGKIVLFKTGLHHAGEVLAKILDARTVEEELVIMSDASSMNFAKLDKNAKGQSLANCNSHALRKFKDIDAAEKAIAKKLGIAEPESSEQMEFFLKKYRKIFENDKNTKKLSSEERLLFHNQNSLPIMESILERIERDFKQKKVEPNSDLGKVYGYFKNHFKELCQFCHKVNAPVCNNLAERMLKGVIRHRKNSLFFKNQVGAAVGDVLSTILFTAYANDLNSIDYMTDLLLNEEHWRKNPEAWLPWNYSETIASLKDK